MNKEELTKLIAKKIKVIRTIRNLNQKELSAHSGVSRISVNRMERGKTTLGIYNYYRIAQVLKVDVSLFFDNKTIVEVIDAVKRQA